MFRQRQQHFRFHQIYGKYAGQKSGDCHRCKQQGWEFERLAKLRKGWRSGNMILTITWMCSVMLISRLNRKQRLQTILFHFCYLPGKWTKPLAKGFAIPIQRQWDRFSKIMLFCVLEWKDLHTHHKRRYFLHWFLYNPDHHLPFLRTNHKLSHRIKRRDCFLQEIVLFIEFGTRSWIGIRIESILQDLVFALAQPVFEFTQISIMFSNICHVTTIRNWPFVPPTLLCYST